MNYNQTAALVVGLLKIQKLTTNLSGIYECRAKHNDGDDDGCKISFCLIVGEYLLYNIYPVVGPILRYVQILDRSKTMPNVLKMQ